MADRHYSLKEIKEIKSKQNIRISYDFNPGDIFTAWIAYKDMPDIYDLRPCVIIKKPNSRDVDVLVLPSTSKPKIGKRFCEIKKNYENNLNKDSTIYLGIVEVNKFFFNKKIGHLSIEDEEKIKKKIKELQGDNIENINL